MRKTIEVSLSPATVIALVVAAISVISVTANVSVLGLIPAFWGVILFAALVSLGIRIVDRRWFRAVWCTFTLAGVIGYILVCNNGMLGWEGTQVFFSIAAGIAAVISWIAAALE
jgi:uncharacterized membrane protein (GlpM family)